MEIESSLFPAVKWWHFSFRETDKDEEHVSETHSEQRDCSGFIYCQRVRVHCCLCCSLWMSHMSVEVISVWRGVCALLQCSFFTPRLPLLGKLTISRAKTGADCRWSSEVISQKTSFHSRRRSTKHRSSQNPINTGPNDGNQSATALLACGSFHWAGVERGCTLYLSACLCQLNESIKALCCIWEADRSQTKANSMPWGGLSKMCLRDSGRNVHGLADGFKTWVMFTHVHQLAPSLSLLQHYSSMRPHETQHSLKEIMDFSGFEPCWKHLGKCTQLNEIYINGLVLFGFFLFFLDI